MFLFWRSWTLVVLLTSVVMIILVLLSTIQFSAILSNFVQGRLAVLVQSTQLSLRSATGLGLSLASVRNAPAILERARQTDPNISAIHVFDQDGRILQSTDPEPATRIPAAGYAAHAVSAGGVWRAETSRYLLSGMGIPNALRTQSIGGVVILYPKTDLETSVWSMAASLSLRAAAIITILACAALGVLRLGLRRLIAIFTGLVAALAALARREWRRPAGGTGPNPRPVTGFGIDTGELLNGFELAEKQYVDAGLKLAALDRLPETHTAGKSG